VDVVEGTIFAGYRVEGRLGAGGMGTVYLARHPRLPRGDALKILSDAYRDDDVFRARFLREAEVAARLHHPNLVAIRDRGEQDGRLWIAMQYVDGVDLAELIRRGPAALPLARVMHILTEVARGLDEIHRVGLLHRDVKPADILLAERPDGLDRVLVTDFGIARPADDSPTLSGAGSFAATVAYAAPEQLEGGPIDRRADVYSLGCTLYHMLTGTVPFPRDSVGATMYAHLDDMPPPPSRRHPGIPARLDAVIATALAKHPKHRYDSCGELAAAARAAATGMSWAGTPESDTPRSSAPAPNRSATWARLRRRLFGGAAVATVVAATVAGTTWATTGAGHPVAAPSTPPTYSPALKAALWGAYSYMADAFPQLLPGAVDGVGYDDLGSCEPTDAEHNLVSLYIRVPVGQVVCMGNQDPVADIIVMCKADLSPSLPEPADFHVDGDERWRLGTGGAGSVYLVAHPRLPRHDALKLLAPERSTDAEYRARFEREAELAGRLDHPNIVAVHDRGVTNGQLWIAMQFVDGQPANVDAEVPDMVRLRCTGDHNPVDTLGVVCGTNTAAGTSDTGAMTVAGDQQWQRLSGNGGVRWGQGAGSNGRPTGELVVTFRDSERDTCVLTVTGGSSGSDLMNRWWASAPI
jgi:serine/threonine-protein kinase